MTDADQASTPETPRGNVVDAEEKWKQDEEERKLRTGGADPWDEPGGREARLSVVRFQKAQPRYD